MIANRAGVKHFTASALIENSGQFLLMHHAKLDLWLYPGGHVEPNEEPQDAVVREVWEEAGIEIELKSCGLGADTLLSADPQNVAELPMPLTMLCERIPDKAGGYHWHIDLVYLGRACDDQRRLLNDRHDAIWVAPDAAEELRCPRELPSLMRRAVLLLAE